MHDGRSDLLLDGKKASAAAGDLVRMPHGIRHAFVNNSGEPATTLFRAAPAGKLRALAALREVPTLAESGIAGFEMNEWEGVVAPAGTSRAIVDMWNRELARIMALPEVRERVSDLGMAAAAPNGPVR